MRNMVDLRGAFVDDDASCLNLFVKVCFGVNLTLDEFSCIMRSLRGD